MKNLLQAIENIFYGQVNIAEDGTQKSRAQHLA